MKLNWRRLGALVAALAMIIANATTALANAPNTANVYVQSNDLLVGQTTGELETVVELNTDKLEGGAFAGTTLATANNIALAINSPDFTAVANNTNNNGGHSVAVINKSASRRTEATLTNTSPPALAMNDATTARNGPTAASSAMQNSIDMSAPILAPNERRNCYGAELAVAKIAAGQA